MNTKKKNEGNLLAEIYCLQNYCNTGTGILVSIRFHKIFFVGEYQLGSSTAQAEE
jgi:hypothetical protein